MAGVPELMILRLLQEREMYGYEIVQAIRAQTREVVRLSEGVVYPVLHALESGSPQLFIDNLDLLSRRSYLGTGLEGGAMDVSFDLYGYLKSPVEAPRD